MSEQQPDTQQTDAERYAGWTNEQLIGEISQLRKAQGGSDKAYSRERTAREEAEAEIERLKGQKQHGTEELQHEAEKLRNKERLVGLREKALEEAAERGLPSSLGRYLVADNESDVSDALDMVERAIADKADEQSQEEIAKRFGNKRKPQSGDHSGPITYNDLMTMDQDFVKTLPPEFVSRVIEGAAKGGKR